MNRLKGKGLGKQLMMLAKEYQSLPKKDTRSTEEVLYDRLGLPKEQKGNNRKSSHSGAVWNPESTGPS